MNGEKYLSRNDEGDWRLHDDKPILSNGGWKSSKSISVPFLFANFILGGNTPKHQSLFCIKVMES